MTQLGLPITTAQELHSVRIAHVLLNFQLWVWPGIKVGHVLKVDQWTVTTKSLAPKVFTVEGFFTQEEADYIMEEGIGHLERSPVDSPDAPDGYHSDRTSYTAFLRDTQFTRNFRVRTAELTRLPSPSFVERLQLVRYEEGQFFRQHEDYFSSKKFVPEDEFALEDFEGWTKWAVEKIEELRESKEISSDFLPGGKFYPDFEDKITFQHNLLLAFADDGNSSELFVQHQDADWEVWIRENVANKADDVITPLLEDRPYMLQHIIRSWEKRIGLEELKYTLPTRPVHPVSHYFYWLQWVKERIQYLLDTDPEIVPDSVRPDGPDYPTFNFRFQNILVNYVFDDHFQKELIEAFGDDFFKWLMDNKDSEDVVIEGVQGSPVLLDMIIDSWTHRAGPSFAYTKPDYIRHFEPNRFVTVFLYLNDCEDGGETVFPYSKERLVTGITRQGMSECSDGLAVPPTKLTAAMFYSQTPENDLDPMSLHGGCPPAKGVKYGANSFAWNTDSDEGANAWDLGEDLKEDPNADDYYVIQEKAGETSESEVPANSEPKETGEELPKEEL